MHDAEGSDFVEKRKHPRFEVQYLARISLEDKDLITTVIDISESGAGLMLPKGVPVGEELFIKVKCGPSRDKIRDIGLKAKIIWLNEKSEEDFCKTGLQIMDISQEDLKILKRNIQELSGKQKCVAGIDICEKTILVVEDTESLSYIMNYDLKKEGFDTIITSRGETGIELAKENQPDLILLDVMLPGIDGFETCRRLKSDEDTKDIPVIIVSVKSQAQDIIQGLEAGASAYVVKTLGFKKLYEKIIELIGSPA